MKIPAKKAIEIALKYVKEIYPLIPDFELEEVELSEDEKYWGITISLPDKNPNTSAVLHSLGGSPRKYKSININANTGTVKAMKIRKV